MMEPRKYYLPEKIEEGRWIVKITDFEDVCLGIVECPTEKDADELIKQALIYGVDLLEDDL